MCCCHHACWGHSVQPGAGASWRSRAHRLVSWQGPGLGVSSGPPCRFQRNQIAQVGLFLPSPGAGVSVHLRSGNPPRSSQSLGPPRRPAPSLKATCPRAARSYLYRMEAMRGWHFENRLKH